MKKATQEKKQDNNRDVLGAYPLQLHVAALPERRFIKMTRTLTILTCILTAILIFLGLLFYYTVNNQNIDIRYGGGWNALYRMNPTSSSLEQIEPGHVTMSPIQLLMEKELLEYVDKAHRVVWDEKQQKSFYQNNPNDLNLNLSVISRLSSSSVYSLIINNASRSYQDLHPQGLIRDVHLYQLKQLYSGWWSAIIDTFDIPVNTKLQSFCPCQDNSDQCLACKRKENRGHNRYRIWIRTSRAPQTSVQNPFGLIVTGYYVQAIPVHDNEKFWGLPPVLRPDI